MWRILDPAAGTHASVFLNGEDVSKRCFQAIVPEQAGIEGPGQVWLYKRNPDGHFYIEPETKLSPGGPKAAHEVLEGVVRWERSSLPLDKDTRLLFPSEPCGADAYPSPFVGHVTVNP